MIIFLNILNAFSLFLSVAFQILLIRYFGTSLKTDVYYLSIGITQFINSLFMGFLMDLYIPVYNDVKAKKTEESQKFTGAVFILMSIIGFFVSLVVFIFTPYIVKIFASGFTFDKISLSSRFLRILCIFIIFNSLTGVLNSTLQANMFIYITYFPNIISSLFNLGALLIFSKKYGIESIIYAIIFSSIINFFILFHYLKRKIGWKFSNPFNNNKILDLIKINIPMRTGNFVYQLQGPITSNILSYFPTGYITLFNYSLQTLNLLFRIINHPVFQVLFVKVSNFISTNKVKELKDFVFLTANTVVILFTIVIWPTLLLYKNIISFLFIPRVSKEQISIMYFLFLTSIPFYWTLSFEVPFTNITMGMKKGFKILQINVIFIILYSFFIICGIKFFNIYTIPIAMFCAQLYNTISYVNFVNKNFNIIDSKILKTITKSSIFLALLIFFNVIFRNHFLYTIYCNFFLIILVIIFMRKEISFGLQFLIKKGEIR